MNMSLEEAIDKAEKFVSGKVKDTGYTGFREVMARLLEEVKKNDNPAAQANEWRDIGTLPKIDLNTCRSDDLLGCWENGTMMVIYLDVCNGWIDSEGGEKCVTLPTHWQLLPEPPTAQDPCNCHACQIADETNEPLPAYILATEADQIADDMATFAGELNLYHVKFEDSANIIKTYVNWFLSIAKQLREELNGKM